MGTLRALWDLLEVKFRLEKVEGEGRGEELLKLTCLGAGYSNIVKTVL